MTKQEQRERQIEQAAEELAKNAYCDKHNLIWFFKKGTEWADQNPNLDEWFDQINVWFMNNDKLRKKIGLSNQYELMLELRKFLNNKHHEK